VGRRPGGYQVGRFPPPWAEWNDQYRDTVRDAWRGHGGGLRSLASRLSGSSDLFFAQGRQPWASVNFVTAHDGFSLHDLTAYDVKHNEANGEDGRDGSSDNRSWNCGVEGDTDDVAVLALRRRQARNLLTTLLLSSGVPMLTMGDEVRRTQSGNNNAYCQDGPLSWQPWDLEPDASTCGPSPSSWSARREHPVFRQASFLPRRPAVEGARTSPVLARGRSTPSGSTRSSAPSDVPRRAHGIRVPGARGDAVVDDSFLLVLHTGADEIAFTLPGAPWDSRLRRRARHLRRAPDRARPGRSRQPAAGRRPVGGPAAGLGCSPFFLPFAVVTLTAPLPAAASAADLHVLAALGFLAARPPLFLSHARAPGPTGPPATPVLPRAVRPAASAGPDGASHGRVASVPSCSDLARATVGEQDARVADLDDVAALGAGPAGDGRAQVVRRRARLAGAGQGLRLGAAAAKGGCAQASATTPGRRRAGGVRRRPRRQAGAAGPHSPRTLFTTPHFDGYPAVLACALDELTTKGLEELVLGAWLARARSASRAAHLARAARRRGDD
jgi:hypothetical protein